MIKLNTNKLLSWEKKKLLERVTRYIGQKISTTNNLKDIEIYKYLGIPNTRISEWKDFDKYQLPISKRNLALCLGGGIVNVNELIENCAETEKEAEFLKTLSIYENKPLQDAVKDIQDAGLDPVEILQRALKEYRLQRAFLKESLKK